MNVPVDGVVLRSSGVQANESAMTGESDELKKDTLEACKMRQEEKMPNTSITKTVRKMPTICHRQLYFLELR